MSNKVTPEELQQLEFLQKQMKLNAFRDASDRVIDSGTKMNQNDIKHITDRLQKGKKKYLQAGKLKDKKAQSLVINELPTMEKEWKNISSFRRQIATIAADGQYGITDDFKASTQGMDVVGILTGDNTPVTNEDGVWGFMMTNPATGNPTWTSLRNISKVVQQHTFDKSSKKVLDTMANHMLELSGQEHAEEFNESQVRRKIKNTIVDRGNIRSLTHDKMLDDSFYNHMVESVKGMDYGDIATGDNGGLANEDAKQIVDLMLLDKETHMNYLTNYYTNYMKQNWVTKKDKINNKNKQQESTNASVAVQGGGKIIGNKYIPKA